MDNDDTLAKLLVFTSQVLRTACDWMKLDALEFYLPCVLLLIPE